MTAFDATSPLLPEIFALHGRWRAEHEALVCGEERESWGRFSARLNRFANALLAHGIAPGERVAVLMANSAEMVHTLFGIMCAGAVSVPLNVSVSDEALLGLLQDAGARAIVASAEHAARIDALRTRLGDDVDLFLLAEARAPGWTGWDEFLAQGSDSPPAVAIADDDLLNIIYSSGTTGVPKGIAHTHRGRRDWAYDVALSLRYHAGARTLLTIGLYSNISWVAMLCTLLNGGTLVLHRRFDAGEFLATVAAERITHCAMVPIQFQRVVERMRESPHEVGSLQAMMSCGSPLHAALKQEIFERFRCGVIELYGLTEGMATILDPEDAPGRWSSVGKPLLGTDIRLVGSDDREVVQGEAGEIVARGRITMPGYYNRPDATRDASWVDPQGRVWLRTGDIGRLDEQNFLYIVDRKKDMILSGGQNVFPQDIEAVLVGSPEIDDCAVIGLPSARWGETPVALVVPRDAAGFDAGALRDWCNQRLGRQQRVAEVIALEALPRNPNGKILKRELRTRFKDRRYE